MKSQFSWKTGHTNIHANPTLNYYYYRNRDGLVLGHVYSLTHTILFGAKIWKSHDVLEEKILGQFVELGFAQKAIETYWDAQANIIPETPVDGTRMYKTPTGERYPSVTTVLDNNPWKL